MQGDILWILADEAGGATELRRERAVAGFDTLPDILKAHDAPPDETLVTQ